MATHSAARPRTDSMRFKKPVLTGGECSVATCPPMATLKKSLAEVSGPMAGKSRDYFEAGSRGVSLALAPGLDVRREMARAEHGANQRLATTRLPQGAQQIRK